METVLGATEWMRMEGKWGGHSGPACLSFPSVLQAGDCPRCYSMDENGGEVGRPFGSCCSEFRLSATGWMGWGSGKAA